MSKLSIMRVLAPLLAVAAVVAMPRPADAAAITFQFQATQIVSATPGGLASVAAGFPFISGTFSYDDSTAATTSSPTFSVYPTGTLSIAEFDIGTGNLPRPFSTTLVNDDPRDRFQIGTGGGIFSLPAGLYDQIELVLSDEFGLALSSTALPSSLSGFPLGASGLAFARFEEGSDGSTRFLGQTVFSLTKLERFDRNPVPEPGSLMLATLGLLMLTLVARRQRP